MARKKIIAIMASAALVAMLGLSACGNQAQSSSSESDSAATSGSDSTTSSSSASESASPASAEKFLVSWQGTLADGTLVNYIISDDDKNGGLALTKDGTAEPKKWLGAMTLAEDGTATITDGTTKETVSFKLGALAEDGTVAIDVEGYDKGEIKPLTAADWHIAAAIEELGKAPGTTVNTMGMLEDGSLMVYVENTEGTKAVVAVMPQGSGEVKTWSGAATTDENGKETVTDETTGETFSYTWTENPEDGTVEVNVDQYGKGALVKMVASNWMTLDELAKQMAQK